MDYHWGLEGHLDNLDEGLMEEVLALEEVQPTTSHHKIWTNTFQEYLYSSASNSHLQNLMSC